MRQSRIILSNAAVMWAARILLLVPQLFLVPYLIATVGEAGYAVYAMIWSLTVSVEHLQLSLQQGVVKYSAALFARGDTSQLNRVVSSSAAYSWALAILMSAIVAGVSVAWRGSPLPAHGLLIAAATVLLIVPLTPYVALIQSRQCFFIGAISETASKYIGVGLIIVWFRFVGPSVSALLVIAGMTLLVSRLAQVPFAYRLVPGLQCRPSLRTSAHLRLLVPFGGAVTLISLCLMAGSTGLRWLMGALVSIPFVAHLAIMMMPSELLWQVVVAATVTVMPAASAYEATDRKDALRELLIRGLRYTSILTTACAIAATLTMHDLLAAWVGTEYRALAPYALVVFWGGAMMQSASIAHHMLKGLGRVWLAFAIYAVGLVLLPLIVILFALALDAGPYVGVAAGTASGYILCGVLNVWYAASSVGANLRQLLLRAYVQPLSLALGTCAAALLCVEYGGWAGLGPTLVAAAGAVGAFLCACYLIVSTTEERQFVAAVANWLVRPLRRSARS